MKAFRKQMSLALALTMVMVCFGCADEIGAPAEDEQPVLPPTNVRALALNDGHVDVLWDASSEPTITGYNVYRREVGHGGPKKINGARILITKYRDTGTVPANLYEYRVTAISAKGKESHWISVVVHTHAVIGDGSGRLPTLDN